MPQRIVWVHGIGAYRPGYSAPWRAVFNPFLNLADDCYLEVLWDTVFTGDALALAPGDQTPLAPYLRDAPLTPRQAAQAAAIRAELATILQARADALQPQLAGAQALAAPAPLDWSDRFGAPQAMGLLPDWLANPDAYLGDFLKYLVSRRIRNAVKAKAKDILRPLVGSGDRCALITHSWGTVVAYDALLDLVGEAPTLRVNHLITLGSPLWLVRPFLQDRSGQKPAQTATWLNVHAAGDPIGSYLRPAFAVDQDVLVPTFGPDPHGSYFAAGNAPVQRDLIARAILS